MEGMEELAGSQLQRMPVRDRIHPANPVYHARLFSGLSIGGTKDRCLVISFVAESQIKASYRE